MHARNGKIARLPRDIREELNHRLDQAEEGPELLPWLNGLPDVKEVLEEYFDGAPITKQNLSEWRQGGFQEWLVTQDMWAGLRNADDFAREIDTERDYLPVDNLATVMAARYAALLSKWDGEVDGKFEAKTRVLDRICRGVVRLQRSTHVSLKENDEYFDGLDKEYQKEREARKKQRVDRLYAMLREPHVARAFGGGDLGRKIAKYITEVENDIPGAKLDLTGDEKIDPIEGEPVQPTAKKRKARRTRKTKTKKADKPLEENEMDGGPEEKTEPASSGSVALSPTDLKEATDERSAAVKAMEERLGLRSGLGLGNKENEEVQERDSGPGRNLPS